ncbi:MAG: hypothetical protein VXW65_03450 [Pseudomonadota bacterium]|nr:hypothetical protein [Pseudomonadota bacterium]
MFRWLSLTLGGCLSLVACQSPVGTPCQIQGDGFSARHNCASQCLSRWRVQCPTGQIVSPQVCAGVKNCNIGSCPSGQMCYHFDDPFQTVSYCIPDTVCGNTPSLLERQRWEAQAAQRAAMQRLPTRPQPLLKTTQQQP